MSSNSRSSPRSPTIPASTRPRQHHQDFLTLNPTYPYIVYNDLPKIENLKQIFPADYSKDPVLVLKAKGSEAC